MLIFSVDSGIEKTGYAIFKDKKYVTSALITTLQTKKTEERIEEIYSKLKTILTKHKPDVIVIEQLFFFKNQKTAVKVSQTQGVIYLLAAQFNIKITTLTPLQIKLALTGYGQADKKSVQKMIKLTTGLDIKQDDEADAVACGLAYNLIRPNFR